MILVKNTEPRLHFIGKDITLWPGWNEVEPAKWTKATEILLVRKSVKAGIFEVSKVPLAKQTPVKAVKTVQNTYSLDLLKLWRENETRKPVIRALNTQIRTMQDGLEVDDVSDKNGRAADSSGTVDAE